MSESENPVNVDQKLTKSFVWPDETNTEYTMTTVGDMLVRLTVQTAKVVTLKENVNKAANETPEATDAVS